MVLLWCVCVFPMVKVHVFFFYGMTIVFLRVWTMWITDLLWCICFSICSLCEQLIYQTTCSSFFKRRLVSERPFDIVDRLQRKIAHRVTDARSRLSHARKLVQWSPTEHIGTVKLDNWTLATEDVSYNKKK